MYDVDEAANKINTVTLTFGDGTADGKVPVVTFTGALQTTSHDRQDKPPWLAALAASSLSPSSA